MKPGLPDEERDFVQASDLIQSRQRFRRRPKRSREAVSRVLTRHGVGQVRGNRELNDVWQQVVGTAMGKRSRPGMIRRGVLEVIVDSATTNQHLTFQKTQILEQLQQQLPQCHFKDLRITQGKIN